MSIWDILAKFGWLPSFILSAFVGLVLSNLKKSFASKEDLSALKDVVTDADKRIRVVEAHIKDSPTRAELQDDISQLASRISAVEAGQRGIEKQLQTANGYLHTLVERGLK